MFRRELRPAPDQIEVVIGPRATFSGQLRCDGSVRLDGTVEGGVVETPANILISDSARVIADLHARTVSIAGAFKGNIDADRVELLEGGHLWGTIKVRSFLLDEGAHFQGELIMQTEQDGETLLVPRPSSSAQIPVSQAPAAGEWLFPSSGEQPSS